MRADHYLIAEDYSPSQRETFERERICVIAICANEGRTFNYIAQFIGAYQAKKVIAELTADGYLQRYRRRYTDEIVYRLKKEAIQPRMFFLNR